MWTVMIRRELLEMGISKFRDQNLSTAENVSWMLAQFAGVVSCGFLNKRPVSGSCEGRMP